MRAHVHIAALLLLSAAAASADGISGLIEEDYTRSRQRSTDQSGATQTFDTEQFRQRYRLLVDRTFFPNLRVNAGGTFEQLLGSVESDGNSTPIDSRLTDFFGSLQLTGPILSGALGYDRGEQTAGTTTIPFGFIREEPSLMLAWRPTDLPTFTLRLARPAFHDRERQLQDIVTNQLIFGAIYAPVRQLDLRYFLDLEDPHDQVHRTNITSLTQSLRAGYDDIVLGGRSTVSLGANLINQQIRISQSAAGGQSFTPLAPIAGYSLVETFPAAPQLDTLVANPALINGDVSSTAGINLGTGRSLAGDTLLRDLGAQFADAVTRANTFWVWVDRQLPQGVAATMQWSAWESIDGTNWTEIRPVSVVFNLFSPRFEITIPETQARWLKVVTRPLTPAATADPLYREVFVTELQLLLVTSAPAPHGWESQTGLTASASARTQIVPQLLAHDVTLFVTSGTRPGAAARNTWLLVNGLSLIKRLSTILTAQARVARQDSDQLRGHEGEWLYSGSLSATPLPTLSGSLVYSGRADSGAQGNFTSNTLSAFAQALPYRGIALVGNASYGVTTNASGQTSGIDSVTFGATVQPHANLSLTGAYGHSTSVTTGGGFPRTVVVNNRAEGTLTFNPVRALYLSAGISRIVAPPRPVTLANASVNFSPFPGGDLQLGVVFTQNLEADGGTTRLVSPNLRWNLRHATITLGYTLMDTDGTVQGLHNRSFNANLRIPL